MLQNILFAEATAGWWSVGIILFELLVGIPSFNAKSLEVGNQNMTVHKLNDFIC